MLYSTIKQNQQKDIPTFDDKVWIFGYGSLIYKVDFPFIDSIEGTILGWERRFWMASQDHRGTPESPGRVLTLHPVDNAVCFGKAYLIDLEVLEDIDLREQNGYLRHSCEVSAFDGRSFRAVVYIGDTSCPVYHPEDDLNKLADIIHQSHGPSGNNCAYVYQLADALRAYNKHDTHVFTLEQLLLKRRSRRSRGQTP